MTTCCGDYHYADCPRTATYEPDLYDDFYDNYEPEPIDPDVCYHETNWSQGTVRQHRWRRVQLGLVQCEHCKVLGAEGVMRSRPDPTPCIARLVRTCSDCESDVPPKPED